MAVNPEKNGVNQGFITKLIGVVKRKVLDLSGAVSDEETRAMAAEAAAKTVVTAGENCSVTKTTASDGHDVYTINADGKPQVQADWNQSDSSKVDYIKNKLKLSNAIDSTSTTEAATPKAVKDAYDELNNKIVARAVFLSQQEWEAQSLLPGDPAKVYYVEDGTGEDAYTVYVWKSSTSAYVEVDESSIDLDGYWHDGPSSSGTGNVVTGMSLGNDGVPVLEKNLTAATLDSNGTVPVSQIPDSIKDKIVFIDGSISRTIVGAQYVYTVTCSTTYSEITQLLSSGKVPICKFTATFGNSSRTWFFYYHVTFDNLKHSFGSVDNNDTSGDEASYVSCVYVKTDNSWTFIEIANYDRSYWTDELAGKQSTISDLSTIRSGASAGASALQPSGDGSNLSVTPDGSSTGYDLGNSTTLKSFAQKFKNLVASLKALAFKDKALTSDIDGVDTSSGDATKYLNKRGVWTVPPGTYSLSTASESTKGGIKVGSNLEINNEVLTAKVDSALSSNSTNPVQNSTICSKVLDTANAYVESGIASQKILIRFDPKTSSTDDRWAVFDVFKSRAGGYINIGSLEINYRTENGTPLTPRIEFISFQALRLPDIKAYRRNSDGALFICINEPSPDYYGGIRLVMKSASELSPSGLNQKPDWITYLNVDLSTSGLTEITITTNYVAYQDGSYPDMNVGTSNRITSVTKQVVSAKSGTPKYALIAQRKLGDNNQVRLGDTIRFYWHDSWVDCKLLGTASSPYCFFVSTNAMPQSLISDLFHFTVMYASNKYYINVYVKQYDYDRTVCMYNYSGLTGSGTNYDSEYAQYTPLTDTYRDTLAGSEMTYSFNSGYFYGEAMYASKIGPYDRSSPIGSTTTPVYVKSDGSIDKCNTSSMSVGNSTKWNNRSLMIGSLGTSTSTIYIIGA